MLNELTPYEYLREWLISTFPTCNIIEDTQNIITVEMEGIPFGENTTEYCNIDNNQYKFVVESQISEDNEIKTLMNELFNAIQKSSIPSCNKINKIRFCIDIQEEKLYCKITIDIV